TILNMCDLNKVHKTNPTAYDKKGVKTMKKQEQQQAHIRNHNHGTIDYSVLGKLAEAGFKDSYRLMHSEFTGTVPTRKDGKGNWKKDNQGTQKRIDFLWCNETASKLVTKSEIIKNELTDVISDHYPVYVELTLNK